MKRTDDLKGTLTPHRIIVLGYLLIAFVGAFLLSLPVASSRRVSQPFIDALFLATSGISTTGLSVVDIGSYYSRFGQLVLLGIFQIGGIGYMCFIVLIMYLVNARVSVRMTIAAQESMAGTSYGLLKEFFLSVLTYTAFVEIIGAVILCVFFLKEYPVQEAVYLGLFHSISAFCTAGFSVFPDSLVRYQNDCFLNATIILISLAGGIGFFVLSDFHKYFLNKAKGKLFYKFAVHTKLVLITTTLIICICSVAMIFLEKWPASMTLDQKALASVFQVISASTTDGFNTIDIGKLSPATLTIFMLLMFVGASPGSTGGGVKTTTVALLFIFIVSKLKRRPCNVFKREIPVTCIYDAVIVSVFFLSIIFVDMILLSITENAAYINILFETVSALGNTGLSAGITSSLSVTARVVLIVTMFIGRVGPLCLAYAILSRPKEIRYSYPQESVYIG